MRAITNTKLDPGLRKLEARVKSDRYSRVLKAAIDSIQRAAETGDSSVEFDLKGDCADFETRLQNDFTSIDAKVIKINEVVILDWSKL